ncbi:MAG: glycoside hydrolase family 2 protein [Saprospiraceae bacterium]|nr:glycoside hydrolase family 2 protein [Saprospiraceae bacterium]
MRAIWLGSFTLLLLLCGCIEPQHLIPDEKINFDWQFFLGDVANGESIDVNTSDWRTLDLPHDWGVEGQYDLNSRADWQTGFLPTGIGWYRKTINWNRNWGDKKIYVHFEGVYINSDIYLNGKHLKHEHHGYLGFEVDLTEHLIKGENILALRVDHTNFKTGRWYTGSGIYRNVWLKVKPQVHIENWGVAFESTKHDDQSSNYSVEVSIENHTAESTSGIVRSALFDAENQVVASLSSPYELHAGSNTIETLPGQLKEVQKWSVESPYLYRLVVSLVHNNVVIDRSEQKVGFRDIDFQAGQGMFINGQLTKIKGVCEHHTAGPFGAAVPDDVLLNRLLLLKEMGANGIRTAHNPFSPTFYSLCDSLGFLVLNEFTDGWEREKASHDYGLYFEEHWENDLTRFVKRDRNHPSVIMWSIGNEVRGPTLATQRKLINTISKYDTLRKITQGGRDPSRDMDGDEIPTLLGIKGFNGHGEIPGEFEHHHEQFPDEILLGTEVPHTYATRGVYRSKTHWRLRDFPAMWERRSGKAGKFSFLNGKRSEIPDLTGKEVFTDEVTSMYYQNGVYKPIEVDHPWGGQLFYQSSYDNATARIGVRQMWQRIDSLPYVIGQYRWTGFDYLGETNNWPSRLANFGIIDIAGFPKDPYYLYQSLWSEQPMVHMLPHWTHPGKEGVEIPVVVYTNCDEVELFLNGESLGKQSYEGEQLIWYVPYQPGTIEAKAFHKDGVIHIQQQTSAKPYRIRLIPKRESLTANRTDVLAVVAEIVDENGILCPRADLPLTFEVKGNAKIIAVDNGDPLDLSNYRSNQRKTFRGKAKIWLQALDVKGEIEIKASSPQIEGATLPCKITASHN